MTRVARGGDVVDDPWLTINQRVYDRYGKAELESGKKCDRPTGVISTPLHPTSQGTHINIAICPKCGLGSRIGSQQMRAGRSPGPRKDISWGNQVEKEK